MHIPLKLRLGWLKAPARVYHMTIDGKKLLAVVKYNWRGVEWIRRYEVVDEVDENLNPIGREFPVPKPASSSAFRRKTDTQEVRHRRRK